MKHAFFTLTLCLSMISICYSLNILGIFPYEGKSHFFVFRVYLQELARRGHDVTVISHFPEKTQSPNYHDISLADSSEIIEDIVPVDRSYFTVFVTSMFLNDFGVKNCEIMLENKYVQDLWKTKAKFDVIVVEQFNSDCALGLAYKLGAPVVGMTSHILMPWHYTRFGIPYNPSYVSFHFLEGGTKPSLYQRIERTIFDAYFNIMYKYMCQRKNQHTLAKYFDDIPPLEDIAKDMKFLLLYTNFISSGSRLFPQNVIDVGGYHVAKPKPLPDDLLKFMDQAENGVIYISFGSVLKFSTMSKDRFEAIAGAISSLPQRIVWKLENKTMIQSYKNIYASDWLPQNDILAHPKTVAFFSHGGNLGTTEATYHGVPIVVMPILGDQPANAAAIEESGLGITIDITELTKARLLAAFEKVLNPKFMAQAKKVSAAWHDRPQSPIDTAIFWTEFAAKHSNLSFRTAAADVPYYQYLCLDVAGIMILIAVISAVLLKTLLSLCCKCKQKEIAKAAKKTKLKSKKA